MLATSMSDCAFQQSPSREGTPVMTALPCCFFLSRSQRVCGDVCAGRSGGGMHQHISGGSGVSNTSVFASHVAASDNSAGE
jgi:hypothetical protein